MPVMRRWALASAALIVAAGLGLAAGAPAHADGPGQIIMDNIRSSSTNNWQGWEPPVQPPGDIVDIPDVTADASDGSIHVDVVTSTGFWDISRNSNGQWSSWEPPPQPPDVPTNPTGQFFQVYSVGEPDGGIEYFQVFDDYLWSAFRFPDGDWLGWGPTTQRVPEDTESLAATAVTDVPGGFNIQVMAMTTGGALWHTVYSPVNGWQSWAEPAQVPAFATAVAAAGLTNGNAEFIAVNNNGVVYHTIRYASGSWASWQRPVQPPAGWYSPDSTISISAAADYYGNAQFMIWEENFATNSSSVYHTIRYANGSWQASGWGRLPLPSGWPVCNGNIAIPTFIPSDTDLHVDAFCVTG
jgi:hypothetical protein